ncbi:MAG: aminotransferase class III-fold pyridoxal phosphate-dependent enzyme, partial [Lachnospiraceae bacterium]|nr:aminotransferase class III-fold pyridoxal phosphate-dependent enzyme [Lachnospiraceae bacterium]
YMEWDKKYYLHTFVREESYQPIPVEKTENDKIITCYEGEFLDFNSQLVSTNVGNSNKNINDRVCEAINRYGFLWEKFLCNYRAEAVYKIIEKIPGMNLWAQRIKFYSSGSESIEAAISLAKMLKKKNKILIKSIDFHGWTGKAGNTTTIPNFGSMQNVINGELYSQKRDDDYIIIPTPFCSDCPLKCSYDECKHCNKLKCIEKTESIILRENPEEIAACITEIVSGFGALLPPKEYIPQLRELLQKYEILWIDDEILTGFGRLGKWFAYQYYDGIYPDIMCVGKGLTNSLVPCSGVIISKELSRQLEDRVWFFGSTFSGHPVAMAAISATIDFMLENQVIEKSSVQSQLIKESLEQLKDKYSDLLENVNGEGFFWSIEFKGSKYFARKVNTKGVFSPTVYVSQECYKRKLILGGLLPWTLRLTPSLTMKKTDIQKGMNIFDEALNSLRAYCKQNDKTLEEMVNEL